MSPIEHASDYSPEEMFEKMHPEMSTTVFVGGNKSGLLASICRWLGSKLRWLWLSQKGWQTTRLEFGSIGDALAEIAKIGGD